MEDRIFEGLENREAKEFPLEFLEAIPVGADLSNVWNLFAVWLLEEVKPFANQRSLNVIERIQALYAAQSKGEVISRETWIKEKKVANAYAAKANAYAAAYTAANAYAAAAAYTAANANAYAANAYAAAAAYTAAYAAYTAAYADAYTAAYAADDAAYADAYAAAYANANAYAAAAADAYAAAYADAAAYAAAAADAAAYAAAAYGAIKRISKERHYSKQKTKLFELLRSAPVC
ncbi:hypothetical protein ACQ4M3_19225 [Leptolyngbya sp. AN03gr2]|uniref:hypothetical protein n=1 Tax=Leptolyngbya sp. AN03gr2 TaxID=3423364 RepID=UPI003D317CA1